MIERFLQATQLSEEAHRGQVRKGTNIEYFSHPLAVAADVLGRGGNYEQAMAGLCHDILEDCGPEYADRIKALGELTYRIVLDCSDCIKGDGPKLGWYVRKLEYIINFHKKDPKSFLVVCCDKLHNSSSSVTETRDIGFDALTKFRAPPEMVCWYFTALTCEMQKGADLGYLPQTAVNDLRSNTLTMIGQLIKDPMWEKNYVNINKTIDSLIDMLDTSNPLVCELSERYFE